MSPPLDPDAMTLSIIADGWIDWAQPVGSGLLVFGLICLCVVAWLTNLIALPGNWICVLVLAVYALLGPSDGRVAIGPGPVLATFTLAFIGEIIELAAGAAGAKRAGASHKSTFFSMVGSVIGAIAGALIGVPIPVVGSLIAAVLFGGIGAAAGAMYGEWTDGRQWSENWSVGHSTFWGKTFGTAGKFAVGFLILVVMLISIAI